MDTVTHALAGYVIVRSGLNADTGRWGTAAGLCASVFPDVDGLLGIFFGISAYLEYHRTLTNSLFLVIPFSLFFAWAFVSLSRLQRFRSFFLIWAIEILGHTFLDLITSYGTMLLSPVSSRRFSLDWLFIVDLRLTASFLVPIVISIVWKARAQTIVRISLMIAFLYISFCAWNHFRALSLAREDAGKIAGDAEEVASLPQPLSPFYWANFIVTEDVIHVGYLNLAGEASGTNQKEAEGLISRIRRRYKPHSELTYRRWIRQTQSPWVKKAMDLDATRRFLAFARFPTIIQMPLANGRRRVEFYDLRFGSIEGRRPFLYVVEFDPEGRILYNGFNR